MEKREEGESTTRTATESAGVSDWANESSSGGVDGSESGTESGTFDRRCFGYHCADVCGHLRLDSDSSLGGHPLFFVFSFAHRNRATSRNRYPHAEFLPSSCPG